MEFQAENIEQVLAESKQSELKGDLETVTKNNLSEHKKKLRVAKQSPKSHTGILLGALGLIGSGYALLSQIDWQAIAPETTKTLIVMYTAVPLALYSILFCASAGANSEVEPAYR